MERGEFIRRLTRLRSDRDPSRLTNQDRAFFRSRPNDLAWFARYKRDRTFGSSFAKLSAELARTRRATKWLGATWASVIRNANLVARSSPFLARGTLTVYTPDHGTRYLLERALRAGAWTELQRAMPVAMRGYRVVVGRPPEFTIEVPASAAPAQPDAEEAQDAPSADSA